MKYRNKIISTYTKPIPNWAAKYIKQLAKKILSKNVKTYKVLRSEINAVYERYVRRIWISKRTFRKMVIVLKRKRQECNGQYHAQRDGNGNLDELLKRSIEQYDYYRHNLRDNRKPKYHNEHESYNRKKSECVSRGSSTRSIN